MIDLQVTQMVNSQARIWAQEPLNVPAIRRLSVSVSGELGSLILLLPLP